MKINHRIVLLASLTMLAAGCASNSTRVTGTEGSANAAEAAETAESALREIDSDGDSVADTDDQCADTQARTMVDSTGCEIAMGVVEGLNFGPNETSLSDEAGEALDRYVDAMQRYPDVVISVEAHTDNRGPAAGNLELSKERVLSVVRYMVSNGINPARIKPFGYGESLPIAANATAEGRELNRRIEIKVLEGLL